MDNTGAYILYEQVIKELYVSGDASVDSEDTTLSNKVVDVGGDKFDFAGGTPAPGQIVYQSGYCAEIIAVVGSVITINKTGTENNIAVGAAKLLKSDSLPKALVVQQIKISSEIIDRATGQFFNARSLIVKMEGKNSNVMFFPVPIISMTEIRMNDDLVGTPLNFFDIYTSRTVPDDRRNPRIKFRTNRTSVFSARSGRTFHRASITEFEGVYGFLEEDGTTPLLIQKAVMKLTIRDLKEPVGSTATMGLTGPVKREKVDLHETEYFEPASGTTKVARSATGDAEIDAIVGMYKAPIIIGGSILDVPRVEQFEISDNDEFGREF